MNYIAWHFYIAPKFVVALIGNYIYFVGHLFSAKVLLKTLFSPWRREIAQKEKPGFNPADILSAVSFNIISRVIGFFVRVATLFTALLFLLLVIVIGAITLVFWYLIPLYSLPIYFLTREKDDTKQKNKFLLSHLEDNTKVENISAVTSWYERIKQQKKKESEFWTKENLSSASTIGKSWSFGYTLLLDKLTTNLATENFILENLVGRQKEIDHLQRALIKEENPNAILTGEIGAGHKTLVIGLAKLIYSGKCLDNLLYKRVLLIDLDLLLGKTHAETQQNLIAVLEEAKKAGDVILVIPSFDQFIRDDGSHINLTEVFVQHLNDAKLKIIGITDSYSYQKYVLTNQTLLKLFEKIDVPELSAQDTLTVIENKAYELEKKYKVIATYEALAEIIKQSQDLITDTPFPQKALDLVSLAFVFATTNKKLIISSKDIDEILSEKTKLPLGQLKAQEKEVLASLESILHKRVIGQDNAIIKVSEALRRKRTGVEIKSSPIGTFLFLGSTGVGKTETAKALAQAYFGNEEKMIRLDMSQFQNDTDIGKLIGDSINPGILTSSVRDNPFSVLLLDEFEKANSKILNLFLTVFDEGYITDGNGKKVSFKNTIIIATSNAGSEFIREKLSSAYSANLDKDLIEYLLFNKVFSPELINRFDAVIFYKPLEKIELEQIAALILEKLNKKLKEEQGISITVNGQTITKLVDKGYDPSFGARNLQRTIQEEIENRVASEILDGSIKKGSQAEINL